MALLNDIGDTFGVYNHAHLAAKILKSFVSEELRWAVEHRGLFQGYTFSTSSG
jgi:predicted HD phosphohydrolase